ncbi:MAG: RIO1 family regulatory kinase/ATPase [Nitrososphaerales archaeon]
MSSAEQAARFLKELEPEDIRVLLAIEKVLRAREQVSADYIANSTKLHVDEVEYRLSRLNAKGFIVKRNQGYSLVSSGLDVIALYAFVKRGLISGMGRALGVGKEADVFEAINDKGDLYAIKFFRIGRISFRDIKRKRAYTSPLYSHQWLVVNMGAAKREYMVLKKLYPIGVAVPEPIAVERHAILMRKVFGSRLSEWRDIDNPKRVLIEILSNLRKAYIEGGIVSSDLSEYNILYDGEKICIIDWPQAVGKEHPNSLILLDRDVLNILTFFRRKFKIDCPLEAATFYVRGWSDNLPIKA